MGEIGGEIIERIRKLLALADNNSSEKESVLAMERAHELLARHNLSMAQVRHLGNAQPSVEPRRYDQTQFDRYVDRWTVDVWHAAAKLFFCRYYFTEEGEPDHRGRRRAQRYRHSLVGAGANVTTAKVMADHFCRTIRRLAATYAREKLGSIAARRSFEKGCADRLVERICDRLASSSAGAKVTGSTLPALRSLYAREADANAAYLASRGVKLSAGRTSPRKVSNVMAEDEGRQAAETISLAMHPTDNPAPRTPMPQQMSLGL